MRRQKRLIRNTGIWILMVALLVTMTMPVSEAAVSNTEPASIYAADNTEPSGKAVSADPTALVDPSSGVRDDKAGPTSPSTDQADPTGSTDPMEPTDPTDPSHPVIPTTEPTKPKPDPPKYFSVYRVEVKHGVMRCYWYNKKGVKRETPQKDKYYIVKFDKGSKKAGTAIKKVGKKGPLYYFNKKGKGKKYTGWFEQSKKKYYFKDGKRKRGTKKIKGIWYKFAKSNGKLVRRIGDSIDKKFQSYTSATSYLVVVKLTEHKVRVYKGKKNRWNRIHAFLCTVGAPSTPTVKGTFTIGSRGQYFNTGTNARCWYWTQFYGNYLFHSVIYDRSPSPTHILDGRLGIDASHGCIRMALSNAKWFNNTIPSGTKVVIY